MNDGRWWQHLYISVILFRYKPIDLIWREVASFALATQPSYIRDEIIFCWANILTKPWILFHFILFLHMKFHSNSHNTSFFPFFFQKFYFSRQEEKCSHMIPTLCFEASWLYSNMDSFKITRITILNWKPVFTWKKIIIYIKKEEYGVILLENEYIWIPLFLFYLWIIFLSN